jgi:hypothetical protein
LKAAGFPQRFRNWFRNWTADFRNWFRNWTADFRN